MTGAHVLLDVLHILNEGFSTPGIDVTAGVPCMMIARSVVDGAERWPDDSDSILRSCYRYCGLSLTFTRDYARVDERMINNRKVHELVERIETLGTLKPIGNTATLSHYHQCNDLKT